MPHEDGMVWVIAKIIGDGVTPETAFRTVVHEQGVRILPGTWLPVDPKTGIPTSEFAMLEIHDEDLPKVEKVGCFVVPKDGLDKAQLSKVLAQHGCVLDVSLVQSPDDLVAKVAEKVADDYGAKL